MLNNKKNFIYTFTISFFVGIYVLIYLFTFLVPCTINPQDCSPRDLGIVVLTMPASLILLSLPATVGSNINHSGEMFILFLLGVTQYALVGYIFAFILNSLKKLFKK